MSKPKFTPGPWFVCGDPGQEPRSNAWYAGRTIGSLGEGLRLHGKPLATRICDLTLLRDDDESAANARLIATAPDLYERLAILLADIEHNDISNGDVSAAKAALAKARGESP